MARSCTAGEGLTPRQICRRAATVASVALLVLIPSDRVEMSTRRATLFVVAFGRGMLSTYWTLLEDACVVSSGGRDASPLQPRRVALHRGGHPRRIVQVLRDVSRVDRRTPPHLVVATRLSSTSDASPLEARRLVS